MNALIVVVDALRTDRVGAYGGRPVTPTMDQLATEGAVFERAYTTINATDPALTSLQTGRVPRTHGVLNHGSHVTEKEKRQVESVQTVPKVLSDSGLDTGAFGRPLGRWHRNGFDRYPELASAHWQRKTAEKSISRFLYGIHPVVGDTISSVYNSVTGRTGSDDETGIVDEFEQFLDTANQFYSFVHLMDTHTPYDVADELVETYLERFEYENRPLSAIAEEFPTGSITANSLKPGGVVNQDNDRWEDHDIGVGTALAKAQYDAAATEADRTISRLLDALQDRNLLEETLIVVLADHGESLGEHGIYFEHHGLYEPTVRIPLIIRPPFETIDRTTELVSITDIAPTVIDLLEQPSFETDGKSLLPLLEGTDGWQSRDAVLLEEANTQRFRGLCTENWKYIEAVQDGVCRYCNRTHGDSKQLYDLTNDPLETTNLADTHVDERTEQKQRLTDFLTQYQPANTASTDEVQYDDEAEVLDRLESLGYR